jgi:hypothetical protein
MSVSQADAVTTPAGSLPEKGQLSVSGMSMTVLPHVDPILDAIWPNGLCENHPFRKGKPMATRVLLTGGAWQPIEENDPAFRAYYEAQYGKAVSR